MNDLTIFMLPANFKGKVLADGVDLVEGISGNGGQTDETEREAGAGLRSVRQRVWG